MATPTQKRLNRTVEEINPLLDKLDEDYTKEQIDEKFSAIAGGIHYKGEVNYYSDLPNDAEVGDAYTVKYAGSSGTTPDGSEYVWGAVSGVNQWVDFSKDTYTKAEVTALLALKQDTIDSSHKLSSDLVDDTNNTHKFATAAQLQQILTNKNNILYSYSALTSDLLNVADKTMTATGFVFQGTPVSLKANTEYVFYVTIDSKAPMNLVGYTTGQSGRTVDISVTTTQQKIGINAIKFTPSANIDSMSLYINYQYNDITYSGMRITQTYSEINFIQ